MFQFNDFNKEVSSKVEDLQTTQSEVNELKRTLQGLEIELQAQLRLVGSGHGFFCTREEEAHRRGVVALHRKQLWKPRWQKPSPATTSR